MHLRHSIFLSIPISCTFEFLASIPQVLGIAAWFLKVNLANFFLSVSSLPESAQLSKMDYCLRESCYGNYERTSTSIVQEAPGYTRSGRPLL